MTGSVVAAAAATKRYGDVLACDRVSLRVGPGEIYALLGLNGAGKTTLIRMLLGMVRPTGGAVSLFGTPVGGARSTWARVGYLVETPAAYPELTVRENLQVVRRLRRIGTASVVDDAIERLGLTAYADRRARDLSLGNAQRLGLAKALLHRPELLILDEPANGLDPAGVVEVRELLRDLAAEHGTTVFLSSHVLAEVARLATRIGIIHDGRMRHEVDASGLSREVRRWLAVSTRDDEAAGRVLRAAGLRTEALSEARSEARIEVRSEARPAQRADGLVLRDERAVDAPDEIATLLVQAGCPPTRLAVEGEDLEAYFLRLIAAAGAPGAKTPGGNADAHVGNADA